MDLSKEAIDKIQQMTRAADGKLVEIDGVTYCTAALTDVRKAPEQPATIGMHTLSALCEYLKGGDPKHEVHLVAINDHASVSALSAIGEPPFHQRNCYARTSLETDASAFKFNQFYPVEHFLICLMAQFKPTPDREKLIAVFANVREENVMTHKDDGAMQTVTAKAGLVTNAEVTVPNPVKLQPFRTFREVDQPESIFICRAQKGTPQSGGLPTVGLFEADGGAWKLEAIKNIRSFIADSMPERKFLIVG